MDIFSDIYNLINYYVFGGSYSIGDGTFQDLAITLVSLCACIFLVSLPFILVYRIIRML